MVRRSAMCGAPAPAREFTLSLAARARLMYISSAMRTLTLSLVTTLFCALMVAQQAPAPPAGVPEVKISQLEVLESSPKVKYPMAATEDSIQGQVILGLTIATDGKVEQVD